MAYSDTLRMEAALCIWEAMIEARMKDAREAPNWTDDLNDRFAENGTVQMRHTAIALADKALETFDLIGGADGAEALELIPYDWEFVPAFVARVDWADCTADPAAIAASLQAGKQGVTA